MQILKNVKRIQLIALFSLLLMFCGHAFCYANLSFSGASVMVDASKNHAALVADGQFLATLYWRVRGALSAPFIVGVLSALYLTASAILMADMLQLSHPLSLFALCGALTLNVSTTAINAAQLHMADVYFLAFLFAAAGAWLCVQHPMGFIPGAACFAAVFGLESSMAAVGPALVLLACLLNVLQEQRVRTQMLTLLKSILSFAVGFALYYAAAYLFCRRQGVQLSAAFYTVTSATLISTYLYPIAQLFTPAAAYPALCAFLFGLLTALGLLTVLVHLPQLNGGSKAFALAAALLLPLVIALPVFGPDANHAVSQRYACCMLPVALVALLDFLCSRLTSRKESLMRRAIACAFGVTFLSSIVFANQVYLKKNLEYQSTLSVMTRVIEMAEQTDGFDVNSTPVAIVGSIEDSTLSVPHKGFEHLAVLDAAANNYTASTQETNTWYFWEIMGYPFNFISDFERDQLAATSIVQAMPAFPQSGCCSMVDGVLVIRLSK